MKTILTALCAILLAVSAAIAVEQRDLGALNPEQAAQYLESHPDAIIVDVATKVGL